MGDDLVDKKEMYGLLFVYDLGFLGKGFLVLGVLCFVKFGRVGLKFVRDD